MNSKRFCKIWKNIFLFLRWAKIRLCKFKNVFQVKNKIHALFLSICPKNIFFFQVQIKIPGLDKDTKNKWFFKKKNDQHQKQMNEQKVWIKRLNQSKSMFFIQVDAIFFMCDRGFFLIFQNPFSLFQRQRRLSIQSEEAEKSATKQIKRK